MHLATHAAVWGIDHGRLLDAEGPVDVLIERTIISGAIEERVRLEEARFQAMAAGRGA